MESGKIEMEEEEHKVYGGEIPEVVGETVAPDPDIDISSGDDDAAAEVCFARFDFNLYNTSVCDCVFDFQLGGVKKLEEMKRYLKEIEKEADVLRELQAKVEKDMRAVQGGKID